MLERAREIADSVLFPAALEVDRAARVPASHLDLLAAEGFYGAAARDDVEFAEFAEIVAALASGCLTTTFVWIQHHTPVFVLAASDNHELRDAWLPALAAGERRAGIGIAGIRNPQHPLRVRRDSDGFVLDGTVPWVTGWDMIDTIYLAARDEEDLVHFLLVDAVAAPTVEVRPQELVAVQASRTVNLTYRGAHVPADRLVSTIPYDEWRADDAQTAALNGFLALGVAERSARLAGVDLDAQIAKCAAALLESDDTPAARADSSALAWHAAGAACVATGARAVLLDQHAQRLAREAVFLLVFGSRPRMRDALLRQLGPT